MEINVTAYVTDCDCSQYSSSIADSGLQNIGEVTWYAAVNHMAADTLVTPEQQGELRDWIREFGAWDDAEIEAMSDVETNALLLQFIAGDVQEMEVYDTPEEYEAAQDGGTASGRLLRGDNDQWYFYVGN